MIKTLQELVEEKRKKLSSFSENDLSKSLLSDKDGELRHHELGYHEGLADGMKILDEFHKDIQKWTKENATTFKVLKKLTKNGISVEAVPLHFFESKEEKA